MKNTFTEILKGKKINTFLIFFFISFMLWTLIKLSNTYTDTISMEVAYTNLSDDKILLGDQKNTVQAQVKTTGFRMLRQKFFTASVEVDLKKVNKLKGDTYYVLANNTIDNYLFQDTQILKVSPDTLFFRLGKNKKKEVPVVHQLAFNFEKGYNLYDSLRLEPKTVTISGPEDLVDAQKVVYTEIKQLEGVNKDVMLQLKLLKNGSLQRLSYSTNNVKAIAKVDKFTEGKLTVPLRVINLPKGYSIKLFPKEVTVIFTANISDFNDVTANDFSVVCDYEEVQRTGASFFVPKVGKSPEKVKSYRIDAEKINFLIKK